MHRRTLPAAWLTLCLVGCGDTGTGLVTSSRELAAGPERAQAVRRAVEHALLEADTLEVKTAEQLTARTVIVDDDGASHVRMDRTYQGRRVVGGDLIIHQGAGGALQEVGLASTASFKAVAVQPTLGAEEAASRAVAVFVGERSGPHTTELVVDGRPGRAPALAYEVVLGGLRPDQTPSELHVLVDATTGALREQWEGVHTAAALGTGHSLYSGPVSLLTQPVGSGYELRDTTRGQGFYTLDVKNRQLPPIIGDAYPPGLAGPVFTDADNDWGTGTTSSNQSAAVDAQYGIKTTYDYYAAVHGRNGIDGEGRIGYNRVHYGRAYNNAYWSDTCFCMTYGDGDGSLLSPLTSLDVAGHEMSHGVTSRTAGLDYSDESGGLNEATSDIFGSLVEFYANNPNDPGDYLIGETIFTPGAPGDALRYMYEPSLDGASPDCWYDGIGSLDVHYSSGVANHFFYLLAEGSHPSKGPASPTCDGSSLPGIGRDKAGKIWYRALTVYMTSSTHYAGARAASLSAASDLYGASSPEAAAVAAAWSAVSVN